MTIVEKIKKLANERKITLAELERRTNLSNGTIRRWDDKTPGVDKVKKSLIILMSQLTIF